MDQGRETKVPRRSSIVVFVEISEIPVSTCSLSQKFHKALQIYYDVLLNSEFLQTRAKLW